MSKNNRNFCLIRAPNDVWLIFWSQKSLNMSRRLIWVRLPVISNIKHCLWMEVIINLCEIVYKLHLWYWNDMTCFRFNFSAIFTKILIRESYWAFLSCSAEFVWSSCFIKVPIWGIRKLSFKLMPKIQNIKGLEKGSKNVNFYDELLTEKWQNWSKKNHRLIYISH